MKIYCVNSGVVAQAREPRSHQKSKHIERRYHKIREFVDKGYVKVCKIYTDLNVSDPMTKPLPRAKHEQHRTTIGVRELMSLVLLYLVQVGDCWIYALEAII